MTTEQSACRKWPENTILAVCTLFVAVILWQRLPELWERIFDPDEFEHLHAAYCVANEMVPYRDFFEHHPPLFWVFLQPLYWLMDPSVSLLFAARIAAGLLTLGIIALTFEIGRSLFDKTTGAVSALFLTCTLLFLQKSFESRPDGLEVLFFLAGLRLLISGWRTKKNVIFFLSGLCMGASFLCSQKVLFPILGMTAIWLLKWSAFHEKEKNSLRHFGWFGAGFLLPFGGTILAFAYLNAADDFLYRCFLFNAQWKVHINPLPVCVEFVRQNPIIFSLGTVAILGKLSSIQEEKNDSLPLGAALGGLAGIAILPVVQRQYLLLIFPLWSIFAAQWLVNRVQNRASHREKTWDFVLAGAMGISLALSSPKFLGSFDRFLWLWLFILFSIFVSARLQSHKKKSVSILAVAVGIGFISPLAGTGLLFWIGVVIVLLFASMLPKRTAILAIVLLGVFAHPFSRSARKNYVRNTPQIGYIKIVMEETGPNETVFDGWSGYGVFRPHAYYYFFLHREIRAMLTPSELSTDIVRALKEKEPKIVIYDENVQRLGDNVRQYIHNHYKPMGLGNIYRRIKS